jgi:peptide/nickel transport system ATP-binding protein
MGQGQLPSRPGDHPSTLIHGPLLEVSDLGVSYGTPAGRISAVREISFSVGAGEVLAIVGESGSGKTTTANAIIGLLPSGGRIDTGHILLAGQDLVGRPESEMRGIRGRDIGLVAQDPAVSLDPVKRVGAQVAEVLSIHGLAKGDAARARAVELLEQAGLSNAAVRARQYPHELSGGMQQRVLIAVALSSGPKLLIADEPTSALDVTIQRQILDHLERLSREIGVTVLMITHDLAVASDRAHRILVMSEGRIVEQGQARELLASPSDAYTRRLIASDPSLNSYRAGALPVAAEGTPDDEVTLVFVDSVVKEYGHARDKRQAGRAVDEVSLTVRRGETLALVGESGSGKTTLARLVLGLSPVTAGSITFDGHVLSRIDARQLRALRRRMQIIYQNPYSSLDPRWTVAQVIEEPLRVHRVGSRAERRARTRELLEHVALPSTMLKRKRSELSGGQCQRVAIARALALGPDLLVCDEPVSALDVTVQDQILRLLARLQQELGLTMLFISHDLAVVRQIADRVAVMCNGKLVELKQTESLFESPQHEYTRQLLDAIPGKRQSTTSSAGFS